jgi:choline-sulfatase
MKSKSCNVLHIILDQLAPHFLPNYGHPVTRAPRISGLSETAFTFDNAYTNSPLCVPARAALTTGKLPSALNVFDSGGELAASAPTLAHYLRYCNYHTCISGKAHFIGPDQLHGFEDRLTSDMCMADFGMSGNWERGEDPLGFYHTMEAVVSAGIAERSAQQDHDEEATYRAVQWLYDWARQKQGDTANRPFYLQYSLSQPHDPYVTPSRYWDLYNDADIDLPHTPYIDPEKREPYSAWLYRHYDRHEYPIVEDHIRAARRAYYGNISYVDELIGRVLDTLDRIGEADNTIIILCSDHGEMLGERGQWYKMSPYEQSARVPLVIKMPGMTQARRIEHNVSLMDIAPTILDITTEGEALELSNSIDPMQGRSMRPMLQGRFENNDTDNVVSELMFEGRTTPALMIKQGRYKFIHSGDGNDLLFDLASDPDELHNLVDDDAHQPQVDHCRAYIAENWDFDAIARRIISDQKKRNFIQKTHYIGKVVSWDYQPFFDATNQYYRSHMTWLEAEKKNMLKPRN